MSQTFGDRALVLQDAATPGDQMLVISMLSLPGTFFGGDGPTPDPGQQVQVTGEVMRFDIQAIEQRIGVNLDESLFAGWADKPVMLATAIEATAR